MPEQSQNQALIEKLAKALRTQVKHGVPLDFPAMARAVLRALAEAGCTEEMAQAGHDESPAVWNPCLYADYPPIFKAMLLALLADEEKQG